MIVENVSSVGSDASLQASNIAFEFEYENSPLEIIGIVNRVANAHWKTFKRIVDPGVDRIVEEAIASIFSPILNEWPIHKVFHIK